MTCFPFLSRLFYSFIGEWVGKISLPTTGVKRQCHNCRINVSAQSWLLPLVVIALLYTAYPNYAIRAAHTCSFSLSVVSL